MNKGEETPIFETGIGPSSAAIKWYGALAIHWMGAEH
jgi:hypothetical protein